MTAVLEAPARTTTSSSMATTTRRSGGKVLRPSTFQQLAKMHPFAPATVVPQFLHRSAQLVVADRVEAEMLVVGRNPVAVEHDRRPPAARNLGAAIGHGIVQSNHRTRTVGTGEMTNVLGCDGAAPAAVI
ncbi:MAG: hypothetical protein JWR11_3363 [Mycobacterium sp.]|jgi:hypothetical protein|nr:hypothetical protein [Mycobacterium sp.]MDT5065690.1 hypothetical protein [Mycobacterium sp.]MDT5178546.1 hypothetical protein [Mycobacterium sp.]